MFNNVRRIPNYIGLVYLIYLCNNFGVIIHSLIVTFGLKSTEGAVNQSFIQTGFSAPCRC